MKRKAIGILCVIMLLTTLACDLSSLAGSTPEPTVTTDPQVINDQALSATSQAETLVAEAVQQTLTAMVTDTPLASLTPSFTFTPSHTLTASSTQTPSATITSTQTITPSIPTITVSADTNCRSGPGLSYELLGVLRPGASTEVIGRTTVENYWLVRNPASPTQICWLWGQYATVTGNWQALPVATQPPTATPAAGFTVTYQGLVLCPPNYAVRLEIRNLATTTWRSVKVDITDTTTITSRTHTSDNFVDRTGCAATNTLIDLEQNEVGLVVTAMPGHFAYDLTGHSLTITVTLFSQDGLAGESTSRTITVTP